MSARGGTETVVRVLGAFLGEQRTWSQRALAVKLGLTVQGLRKRLKEMQESGIPFEREHDPPEVYWSLPRGWVPGALSFEADEVVELMRALARSPRTKAREKLLKRVRDALPTGAAPIDAATIDAPTVDDEATLKLMEDAIRQRVAVEGRYRKGRSAVDERRTVSPQRLDVRERPRVAAVCHRSDALRWFRLDGFSAARLDRATAWRAADPAELRRMFDESLGGFRDGARRRHHARPRHARGGRRGRRDHVERRGRVEAPAEHHRARIEQLVREGLAAVASRFPALLQWHTAYDHPSYHSTYPWRA